MTAGTMTRAAEILRISQPAVSNTIATLEHRLGFKLFLRKSGRLQPTPEALIFYDEAQRVLEAVGRASDAAQRLRRGAAGHLTISAFPGISIKFLPRLISQFQAERPDVKIRLLSRSSHVVIDQLPSQLFDIAIAEKPAEFAGVSAEKVSFTCQCLLPPGHPLAVHDTLTPELLDGVPFAALFRDHMTTFQIARAFSDAGARWNVVLEAQYFASVAEFVKSSGGAAIVDPVNGDGFTEGCILRPFSPTILYQIGLLVPQDKPLSKAGSAFLSLLHSELQKDSSEKPSL